MPDTDNSQSIVKTLIAKNTPAEQSKPEEQSTDKEIEIEESEVNDQTDNSKIENSLLTEEFVKALRLPNNFIGKPLKEAGNSNKELYRWANENNKAVLQLKDQVKALSEQLTAREMKEVGKSANEITEEELGKIPNQFDDPSGFAKWLLAFGKQISEEAEKKSEAKISKKFEDNPQLKQAEEIAFRKTWDSIAETIQAALPTGLKAAEVLNAFLDDNDQEEMYVTIGDKKISIYDGKPKKFVNDVLRWLKAQSYEDLKNQKESELNKIIHKKTKENLEKLNTKTAIRTNVTTRKDGDEKPETVATRLVAKLQESQRLRAG